jgi:4-amino-4-deoxy-L-arabinose transferase-like glycosyltransferase
MKTTGTKKAPAGDRFLSRRFWLLLILITILGLALRAADLRADPPPDLSWSFAPYTDESLNTYSARNLVLYGTWKTDDFLPFVIYPLVNLLVALMFKIFGIGFVQVKLLSLFAGVIGILIIALLNREENREPSALLVAFLYATCYPLVMYSRLGLVETVEILFLLLTGFFWGRGLNRPVLMPLAGFFATGTVLLVKLSAVFLIPVMLLLIITELKNPRVRKRLLPGLGYFSLGILTALICWLLLVYLPYRNEYLKYVLRHSSESPAGHPRTLAAYLFNTFTFGLRSRLISRMVYTAVPGYLTLPFLGSSGSRSLRYAWLWFIFGLLLLGYMNYRPPRYEIILLPVLLLAAATALTRFLKTGTLLSAPRPSITKTLLYAIWLMPFTLQLMLHLSGFRNYPQPGNEAGILKLSLLISLLVCFAGYGLLRIQSREISINSPWLRSALVALLLLLSIRLDLSQFYNWFSNRTYNLLTYSRVLDRLLPENAVVAGPWAPPLMIESRKRAIAVTDWANIDDPVNRFGTTHLLIGEGATDQLLLEKLNPATAENLKLLRQFPVRGQVIRLFALPRLVSAH